MISFIVPAYNEARLLGATLDALHSAGRAVGEPYEIVVADDGSTDGTAAIAAGRGAAVVTVAHRQIAATRNSGARRAQGEWFVFVDADTIVTEAVVLSAVLRRGGTGHQPRAQAVRPVCGVAGGRHQFRAQAAYALNVGVHWRPDSPGRSRTSRRSGAEGDGAVVRRPA